MQSSRRRLWFLIGLFAVLAIVYLILHGLPGSGASGPADRDEALASSGRQGPGGGDAAARPITPEAEGPVSTRTYRDVVRLSRRRDPRDLPRLKEAAGDPEWKKRYAAVAGIGQLREKGDPELLLSVLSNPAERPEVRAVAAESLGAMRYYQAGPALMRAMEDGSLRVRAAAGVAMRNIMRVRYGYRANDSAERRRKALGLMRADWPRFYSYMKSKQE